MRRQESLQATPSSVALPETGLLSYSQDQLNGLMAKLAGSVVVPGAPGYNDARMVFMHTYQHYPQLIVNCVCYSDVVAALAFARETRLKVATRSGGHSTAGYSVNDQLVIDMSGISHVLIDKERKLACVGAGANFRKLNLMLDMEGLHVPGGGCESVCVAGYMQGGGYGFTSRLFGMNCDCVESVTVALADGRIVRAAEDELKDLFWAIRGGTGNQFGVLLEIEYRLVELRDLFGFGLRWMMRTKAEVEQAVKAVTCWQEKFTKDCEKGSKRDRSGTQALFMHLPVSEDDPTQLPQLLIRGVFDGSEKECLEALRPLIELMDGPGQKLKDPRGGIDKGDPLKQIEIWERGSYLHLNEILLLTVDPPGQDLPTVSMNTKPLVDSRIVEDIQPQKKWAELAKLFLEAPDLTIFIAMESYGGRINARKPTDTAFVHRTASLDLFTWVFWTFDDHEKKARKWLRKFGKVAGGMSNGRRYQNYPLRENENYLDDYFGGNLGRLIKCKSRYDPDDLFDFGQSIPTAG
jgi:FAD/FMN-containing dehydrogenase